MPARRSPPTSPIESLERHSVTCAFGVYRHPIHNGLVLQIVAIAKEAGFPGDSIEVELRGMRALDDTRPGDLVALDFYGDGHHLVLYPAVMCHHPRLCCCSAGARKVRG